MGNHPLRLLSANELSKDPGARGDAPYHLFFEMSPVPMWLVDQETFVFLAVNSASVELSGYSQDEFLRMTLLNAFISEERLALLAARWRIVDSNGGAAGGVEILKHRKKDGEIILVKLMWRSLFIHGRPVILVIVHDITEQSRAEASWRDKQQRYETLINSVDGIVWEADVHTFRFTLVSRQAERLLGYPLERWLTEPSFWQDHLHPEDREWAVDYCRVHSLKKEPYTLEYRMIAADGRTVWLKDLVTVAAEVDQSTILRGVMVDITAQKNLEEHLRQAQKVEAVGRLAGGIAHDFNNLLTVINGYTELLLNRLDPQDLLYRHISLIKEAGCRTASLTKQLLAFSRKQVLAPVVVDLNQMIAKMEGMVQRLVGEGIQLVLAPGASRSLIKVDPGQLDQVIMNLVVNAADAMPGTGRLSIETANIELDETYIPLTASFKPGPYVMLAVSDTGAGMDKETIAHIFEPFFTTKPSEKGTGLGLSTVYGIVTQSGGDIAVESRPGAGTTFKVFFPRVEEGALTDYKPVTEESDNHLLEGGETILVAEDEPDVRAFVCTVLQQHGYTVLQARHGVEALLLADQHQGLIPLLITDMVMPQMPGTEVAAKMMKTRAGLKVLYISGYSDNPAAHHDVIERGVAFLQKPFTVERLLHKVREVLDGSHASHPVPGDSKK